MSKKERKTCIRCSKTAQEKDQYCTQCGSPLENKCTYPGSPFNDPCTKVNEPHAAFCASCGAPTIFYQTGLITTPYAEGSKWNREDIDDFDYFSHRFFQDNDPY